MQVVICNLSSGGVLDKVLLQFGGAISLWQNQISPLAKKIFFILFSMEFMWQLTVKKVFAGDIEKLWVFFFSRVVLCFFFAKYFVDVEIYKEIIEFFANLGGQISGYTISLDPNSSLKNMGPSEVIGHFSCISDSIHRIADNTGTFDYITLKFYLALMQVILFVTLSFMAFYLMKVILQAYFILYAGFILTGFAGSSWTKNYWNNYIQAVSGIAIKFLAVCFLLGNIAIQMKGWVNDINSAANAIDLSAIIIKVVGSAIIFTLLTHELPEWAASILANNVNMKFGSQISTSSNVLSGNLTNK